MFMVGMGCRMEPAIVHGAHVLQKLHFFLRFSIFFIIYTTYRKKNHTHLPQKENQFCDKLTRLGAKKKLHAFAAKKRLHDLTIFLYTSYIFHVFIYQYVQAYYPQPLLNFFLLVFSYFV